jgi:murein DD-endopeptidase MepM/ murein hydrolase activator NlpD
MRKRCALALLFVLVAMAAPTALADNGYDKQKAALDAKLEAAQATIARTRTRESRLSSQIATLNGRISDLEARFADLAGTMSALQADLGLRRRRLEVLHRLYRTQTARVLELRRVYRIALARLDLQLVTLYESPRPGAVELVLQSKTFQDVLDEMDYLNLFAKQDEAVAKQVDTAKRHVVLARARTADMQRRIAHGINLINARLEQEAVIHNELLTRSETLSKARSGRSMALLLARAQEHAAIQESNATQAASAQIEAKIRAAETQAPSAATGAPAAAPEPASSAGLIWPVNGPITSPFGPRWGGFHPGIDIGVPTGTPIHAATAGTVIWCGWQDGYGNLVVIDAHNGIATAYAHQSRIAVTCDQNVTQGQVIGYVGCTGFCTGPHLHFEVRVNGIPVDPLGYLP